MPIYSNLYSNASRQGVSKALANGGYTQSLVAATHPVSYTNQAHRKRFTRRPSSLGKFGSYTFQNAFQTSSISSSSIRLQDGRHERPITHDGGLEAYFEAWKNQHKAGEPEEEWTQFQFAKRIEWKPTADFAELQLEETSSEVERISAIRVPLERSYSASAVDDFKNVQIEAVGEQLEDVATEGAKEVAFATRVPTPPVAPWQSPALTAESTARQSPASSVTTISSTIDIQSQKSAEHLTGLSNNGRYDEIVPAFAAMLAAGIQPIAPAYNALLAAALRLPGDTNQIVPHALTIYTDMLKRKVSPDTNTYDTLINLLASRSLEVSTQKKSLETRRIRFGGMKEAGKFMLASNELDYAILSEDDRLDVALKMFDDSTLLPKARSYPAATYLALISACAQAARVSDMVRIYEHMEASKVVPVGSTFPPMIEAFGKSLDLSRAVLCYTEYRDMASAHDNGQMELAERQDASVYATLVKAYVDSDRMPGAMKFYNKIISTWRDEPAVLKALQNTIVSKGFVQSMIENGNFTEALVWAETLEASTKVEVMSKIATAAADRGDKLSSLSAFSNLPLDFSGIATPTSAMLALSVREGDVAAAAQYWQILNASATTITSELIEPTAMYAVAMIGSGQIAEGLSQSEQMFGRIKASATVNNVQINDEVEEGIDFVGRYMADRGVTDPRLVEPLPLYQQEAYTPTQYAASVAPSYEDAYDPYAGMTDLKGSALIGDELERSSGRPKPARLNDALTRFRNIRRAGRHPRYITYAKLISAAAREEKMDTVQEILEMARADVPLLTEYAVVRYGWVSILDAMVGACLTLGNRGMAAQYHRELLDMGAAPTANTFGLYITTLKESTKTFDEASEAVKIFHRAKSEGVEPTSFLYNALIGKLGKARRIDDCLFYFAEMRNLGIRPTSVTYGTIVNALCRVSDEKFAEQLFEEMESMPNYKARPAPYNSLMQFFLTTKRDKSKVLAYYERMKSKGIQPTNHTYKLLVDTHATLEPINMAAAEAILDLIRSTGQKPEAVHYSALIHAKGCNLHDIDGARAVFDAVLSDPSIRPQACLYQAMFEGMVANHRVADTESIFEDMASRKVEMTPYIANCLIHGWASEKKIEKSKAIFANVAPSKREPSTYEAMTRAYLAVEDRQSAKYVVQEMLSRGYPSAVSGKILELVSGGNSELL